MRPRDSNNRQSWLLCIVHGRAAEQNTRGVWLAVVGSRSCCSLYIRVNEGVHGIQDNYKQVAEYDYDHLVSVGCTEKSTMASLVTYGSSSDLQQRNRSTGAHSFCFLPLVPSSASIAEVHERMTRRCSLLLVGLKPTRLLWLLFRLCPHGTPFFWDSWYV